ncbi:MAG: polysaccharide deacetylase [Solobacterium sp.]|nr:polysaccharide deacetylase [Solobacterium sp.]
MAWYALKEGVPVPKPTPTPTPKPTPTPTPKPTPTPTPSGSETKDPAHTIYLTFDDGPSKNTRTLLDVLKKYPKVKVSFFVVNQATKYVPLIEEEAAQGHTVAVHSYTHDYSKIYTSSSAYWADFDKMNAVVQKYTGKKTTLFRFPGGSSNTVSRRYCKGIMTKLSKEAGQKGYTYFDWNVSSGDAGETKSTDQVYKNVINGIKSNTRKGRASVVLQHDSKSYSVAAVERIIKWGLENGYTFKALTKNSPTAHHHLNN